MSWLDRQSFLGPNSERRLAATTVGLVGVGGGNSHVAQQLAHVGIGNFVLADGDRISLTNLNRLIGGTWWYVLKRTVKVEIMKRMIKAINPKARVEIHRKQWQLAATSSWGALTMYGAKMSSMPSAAVSLYLTSTKAWTCMNWGPDTVT